MKRQPVCKKGDMIAIEDNEELFEVVSVTSKKETVASTVVRGRQYRATISRYQYEVRDPKNKKKTLFVEHEDNILGVAVYKPITADMSQVRHLELCAELSCYGELITYLQAQKPRSRADKVYRKMLLEVVENVALLSGTSDEARDAHRFLEEILQ